MPKGFITSQTHVLPSKLKTNDLEAFEDFKRNFKIALNSRLKEAKVCTEIRTFLNDDSDIIMSNNEEIDEKAKRIYIGIKKFGLFVYAKNKLLKLKEIKKSSEDPVLRLCNTLKDPLYQLQTKVKELKETYKVNQFKAEELAKLLNHTTRNNIYHILAYLFTFRKNINNSDLPDEMKNFLSAYFEAMEKVSSEHSLFAVPFIVFYLLKDTINYKDTLKRDYNQFNYMDQKHYNTKYDLALCATEESDSDLCKYKPPLVIAFDQMIEASKETYRHTYMQFYERYIASLIYIARVDLKNQYQYNYNKKIDLHFEDIIAKKLKDKSLEKDIKNTLSRVYNCL